MLDFVGQHSALYKSQVFQDFFVTTQTVPNDDNNLQFETDDIVYEDSVDAATNTSHNTIKLNNETPAPSTSSSLDESIESSSMSTPVIDSPNDMNSDDGYTASMSTENGLCINDISGRMTNSINTLDFPYRDGSK